ncbi:YgjP-like metallopeptidase domain-containing protein [uncultured Tolumonas sp.]|uniref:YgjP-like metallopeptidase domain-containing protein n=1 Tax=uncultured Tolumonas sp. TaxID=263765 RepID=UPI00292EA6D2|nr:YgjP-like metallopeptidase domain-containing protein [uncultured Tolumonas sp.]
MSDLMYLNGYPEQLLQQVRQLITKQQLGEWLAKRYPERHDIQSDTALFDYVAELKNRYMRNVSAISKVRYDSKLSVVHHALGLNVRKAQLQGSKIKRKHDIIIASVFREAPPEFLRMIAVHELAHLKETQHDKAFYQFCTYMEPAYHQLEFDFRVFMTNRDLIKKTQNTEI